MRRNPITVISVLSVFLFFGLGVGCTSRMVPVTDLDPVVEFAVDEQSVHSNGGRAEIPIEMSRVASESVTILYTIEGGSFQNAGSITFPEGVRDGVISVPIQAGASAIQVKMVSVKFAKMGKRILHTIKVAP